MGSDANSSSDFEDVEEGIIPRVLRKMFQTIEEKKRTERDYRCELKLSFIELYGEEIKDLLTPYSSSAFITIRETEKGQVQVTGIKETAVSSFKDCFQCLRIGSTARTTACTFMNATSSRSHAILTLRMVQHCSVEVPIGGSSAPANTENSNNPSTNQETSKTMTRMETKTSYFHFVREYKNMNM